MSYLEQLGVLLGCCVAGDALSLLLRGRLPGNILGLTLLLVLLICGMVKPAHVADTADFLLRNMAILFLPACLGVLDIFTDIKTEILGIIAVCALTTLCTAAATALTVHLVCRLQRRAGKEGGA